MTTVNSKKELKEALQRGETEFYTTNKKLLRAAAFVAKHKTKSNKSKEEIAAIAAAMTPTANAIDQSTIVAISIVVAFLIISLYALFKNYELEVDVPNGRIKATKKG